MNLKYMRDEKCPQGTIFLDIYFKNKNEIVEFHATDIWRRNELPSKIEIDGCLEIFSH